MLGEALAFDLTSFIFASTVLGYCAYSDWKTREVSDRLWVFSLPIAWLLTGLRVKLGFLELFQVLFSIGLTVAFAFLLAFLSFWGDGDFKAFWFLASAYPVWPRFVKPVFPLTFTPFPIAVLFTTLILSVAVVPHNWIRNLIYKLKHGKIFSKDAPFRLRFAAVSLGYIAKRESLKNNPKIFPLETVTNGKRRFKFFVGVPEETEIDIEKLHERLFVAPLLPFLSFTFPALILSTFIGDILATLILKILGTPF